jgi:hypothetical protein
LGISTFQDSGVQPSGKEPRLFLCQREKKKKENKKEGLDTHKVKVS